MIFDLLDLDVNLVIMMQKITLHVFMKMFMIIVIVLQFHYFILVELKCIQMVFCIILLEK